MTLQDQYPQQYSLPASPASAATASPSAASPMGRQLDPSTDTPTVWMSPAAPVPANHSPADTGKNTLALISLIASLIFPIAVAINLLSAVAQANHLIPARAMAVVFVIGGGIGTFGIPAMLTAIATGHIALVIAKRYPRSAARRWMAIVGLIIGCLSLLAFGGTLAIFLVAGMNGF